MVSQIRTTDAHHEFIGTACCPGLNRTNIRQAGHINTRRNGQTRAVTTLRVKQLDHRGHAANKAIDRAHWVPPGAVSRGPATGRSAPEPPTQMGIVACAGLGDATTSANWK